MISKPGVLLQLEGAVLFLAVICLYRWTGAPWWLFAVLFLFPDLAMVGYLANAPVGSVCYNLLHFEGFPVALAILAYSSHRTVLLPVALIWTAHIELDRALGFGLKYPTFFKDTHLQRVSQAA